MNRLQSGGCKT